MISSFVVHSSSNRWTLQRRSQRIAKPFWVIHGLTLLLKRRHCPLGVLVELISKLTHNWKLYPPTKVVRDWEFWSSGWEPWCEAIMVRRTLSTSLCVRIFRWVTLWSYQNGEINDEAEEENIEIRRWLQIGRGQVDALSSIWKLFCEIPTHRFYAIAPIHHPKVLRSIPFVPFLSLSPGIYFDFTSIIDVLWYPVIHTQKSLNYSLQWKAVISVLRVAFFSSRYQGRKTLPSRAQSARSDKITADSVSPPKS